MATILADTSRADYERGMIHKIFVPDSCNKCMSTTALVEAKDKAVDMIAMDIYRYAKKRRMYKINPTKLVLLRAKRHKIKLNKSRY